MLNTPPEAFDPTREPPPDLFDDPDDEEGDDMDDADKKKAMEDAMGAGGVSGMASEVLPLDKQKTKKLAKIKKDIKDGKLKGKKLKDALKTLGFSKKNIENMIKRRKNGKLCLLVYIVILTKRLSYKGD